MSRWNHTIRAGCQTYIEQGEAEFVMTRLYEAGERLNQVLKQKLDGGEVPQEYLELIVKDWEALRSRHKLG